MSLQTQIEELSPEKFDSLVDWVLGEESERRREKDRVEVARYHVIQEMVDSGIFVGPKYSTLSDAVAGNEIAEWKDPKGEFPAMYPPEAVVRVGDRVFSSELSDRLNGYNPYAQSGSWAWKEITHTLKALHEPAPEPEVAEEEVIATSPWYPNVYFTRGERVEYFGNIYQVQRDHTSQVELPPDLPGLTSLYVPLEVFGDDELGLQDGATPASPALNDADSEADSST